MEQVESLESLHEKIVNHFNFYMAEHHKFEVKGIKASAARARKALGGLAKLAKSRRAEIQDAKNSSNNLDE
jgi:hypothetical protein